MQEFSYVRDAEVLFVRDENRDRAECSRIAGLTKKIEYINRNTEILIAGRDFADSVRQVMTSVREYYEADRVFMFEIDESQQFFNNTFEICAAGVAEEITKLQGMPWSFLDSWTQQFNDHGFFYVDDVETCNDTDLFEGRSLQQLLRDQKVATFFAVPIMEAGRYLGFIGVDNPRASLDDIDFLVTMVRYVTIHMAKHRMDQNSRRMADVLNTMPTAFILFKTDADGNLEPYILSQSLCRLLGGSEADCHAYYGTDGFNGVHPEDLQRVKSFFQQHRYDATPSILTYRVRNIKGTYIWFRVSFIHVRVGGQTYLYVLYTDVDDIKKREEELQKHYEDEQTFLDSVADRYFFTARANLTQNLIEGMWGTDVAKAASKVRTYSQDVEIMAEYMLNQEQKDKYRCCFSRQALLAAHAAGQESRTDEFCYIGRDRKLRWLKCRMNFVRRPESGDVIAFITETDITREKIVETIMDQVVASQYDYVMCIRCDDKSTNIIHINQQEGDNVDIHDSHDYDESVRLYAEKYVLPEERPAFLAFMDLDRAWSLLSDGLPCAQTFSFVIDGQLCYKKLGFYCIDKESRLLVNVRTDFTDVHLAQVEQEAQLREALRLANEAGQAKDDFLSRMSHDIRTPLNGIIGMTTLAKGANSDPAVASYLNKINVSSHFLLGLVNDILDMSKIAAGKMELHPEPYSETDFINYIRSVIQPLGEAKGIHFHIPPQELFNCQILVDKLKYNQIFFNLLSNAVKFTPPGGHVTLDVRNPVISTDRVESDFIIADDGIGMSDEFQKRLFQPFEQEHSAQSSEREGTGLGLAIAKRLIDMMGGTISVQSAPGAGSTFTLHFSFPLANEVPAAPEPAVPDISLDGLMIMVAEDNDINGEIVVTFLQQKRAEAVLVKNGREAVQRFARSPVGTFDAILMDVRMPVMDGLEATRRIRALPRPDALDVPIIATTANAYDDDVKHCLAAGMNDHVAKPIEAAVLFQSIHRLVKKTGTPE